MINLTELLLQGELSVQQRHYLELSRSSSTHLQRLVDEVLDLSKIKAGGMAHEQAAFLLHEFVDELLPVFSACAADKGLQLYSQIRPQLPPTVLGDSMRLRQVLSNLVGNAVKFTTALGLTISADLLELMDSKLQFESAPGQGCTFHFEIDFALSHPAPGQNVTA